RTATFMLHCTIANVIFGPLKGSKRRSDAAAQESNQTMLAACPDVARHGHPERMDVMTELNTGKAKAAKTAAPVIPLFDRPQFALPRSHLPKLELPSAETPAALREIAEQSIAQAKATYEKAKAAAEQASGVLERSYVAATEGAAAYNRQVIDAARANVNAAFDFAIALLAVKSPTDVVEVSAAHAREQFQAFTEQAKALGEIARKLATETAEPIQAGVSQAFQSAA